MLQPDGREKHYSFGLRTLMAVLELALHKFTTERESDESKVMAASLRETIGSSLKELDVQRMEEILAIYFPSGQQKLEDTKEPEQEGDLVRSAEMRAKVAAVRATLDRRAGVILTGPTMTGKTRILQQVVIITCQHEGYEGQFHIFHYDLFCSSLFSHFLWKILIMLPFQTSFS